jgi:hypothetical protein
MQELFAIPWMVPDGIGRKTGGGFHDEKKQKQYQKRKNHHAGILGVRSGGADGDGRLCKKQQPG